MALLAIDPRELFLDSIREMAQHLFADRRASVTRSRRGRVAHLWLVDRRAGMLPAAPILRPGVRIPHVEPKPRASGYGCESSSAHGMVILASDWPAKVTLRAAGATAIAYT